MSRSDIGVVIVHYHREDYVERLVDELIRRHQIPEKQIVLADNGSDTRRINKLQIMTGITVVSLENVGYGAAVNLGVEALPKGLNYVAVMTHEVTMDDGCLDTLAEHLDTNPRCGIAGPLLRREDDRNQIWSGGGLISKRRKMPRNSLKGTEKLDDTDPRVVSWLDGATFMISIELLYSIGGVAEGFFLYFEDVDLGWKIRKLACLEVHCVTATTAYQSPGEGFSHFLATRNLLWMHKRQQSYCAWVATIVEGVCRLFVGSFLRPKGARARQIQRLKGIIAGSVVPKSLRVPLSDHVFNGKEKQK